MRRITAKDVQIRNENREAHNQWLNDMKRDINEDLRASLRRKSEQIGECKRKQRIAREADKEFQMAMDIYNRHQDQEDRKRFIQEQDNIAMSLAEQQRREICEQKERQALREESEELRTLRAKLQTALINQTREFQMREQARIKEEKQREEIEKDNEMLRIQAAKIREFEEQEKLRYQEMLESGNFIRQQLSDRARRQRLLEAAQREHDKMLIDENIRKEREEWVRNQEELHAKHVKARQDMEDFMEARRKMKEEERRRDHEEKMKMYEFTRNVDERLARALEEQKLRNLQKEKVAKQIGETIMRQREEKESYENLCIELAAQEELERLKAKEIAEAEKIKRQMEECQMYMLEYHREKQRKLLMEEEEKARYAQEMRRQQQRLMELEAIELEQNRLRLEEYRRQLRRQVVQKKEMFEEVRQQELRRLRQIAEIEERRQRIIEEERRKLVIEHVLSMGPESVRFLPKGVLKEDDLNYLPPEYVRAILNPSLYQVRDEKARDYDQEYYKYVLPRDSNNGNNNIRGRF